MGNFQRFTFFGLPCPAVSEWISETAVLKNHYFQVELLSKFLAVLLDIIETISYFVS